MPDRPGQAPPPLSLTGSEMNRALPSPAGLRFCICKNGHNITTRRGIVGESREESRGSGCLEMAMCPRLTQQVRWKPGREALQPLSVPVLHPPLTGGGASDFIF